VVLDEDGQILRAFLNKDQQWYFPPNEKIKIPEKLEKAVLTFEDRYFYYHPGVNPVSIVKAIINNISAGKIKSGASTITMQLVRLALKNKRNIWNKCLEVLQAIKLEIKYSKKELLRMYIENAPYGGNIIGYQAAVLKYFKKIPEQITWSEAALLAVLPNSPGLISPTRNPVILIKKRNSLLKKLKMRKIINSQTYNLSIQEPINKQLFSFFITAPHLAQTLKNRLNIHSGYIRTTIKKEFQVHIEQLLTRHLHFLNSQGIQNGAVLVAETRTGKIRVYLGSQNFFDIQSRGQNDGIISSRSTGSILKPFLYALALDEGIILPSTMMKDIPSYFGTFSPSNADKNYDGLVTAKEALIRSLNVPASRLLNTYGIHKFYHFLKSAGMTTLFRKPDDYGLTLILGGAEANLYDLVKMYCGLGNRGNFIPLTILFSENKTDPLPGIQLISPEASYLTLNMIKDVKRPGAEYYWEQYNNQYPVAWKTGTSYGQRDAWSVGVTPQWTVAVWVGNFSGEGNPNLSGASCAAPLMFDIFNDLPKSTGNHWFDKSGINFKIEKICLDTGFRAGPSCERIVYTEMPRTHSPLRTCPYHKTLFVTHDEKFSVCSLCWKSGQYKPIKKIIFTPDVAQYLRKRGLILSRIPPHQKNCPGLKESKSIQIIYPTQKSKIWIPRDFGGQMQKVTLQVAHGIQNRPIYWYIDDIYKGKTIKNHKMALTLEKGWHKLVVIDSEGNRDQRTFFIAIRSD
jgi:penicillin-binding protein 1C